VRACMGAAHCIAMIQYETQGCLARDIVGVHGKAQRRAVCVQVYNMHSLACSTHVQRSSQLETGHVLE